MATPCVAVRGAQAVPIARAMRSAVEALATMQEGLQVIGAARLRERVGDPVS